MNMASPLAIMLSALPVQTMQTGTRTSIKVRTRTLPDKLARNELVKMESASSVILASVQIHEGNTPLLNWFVLQIRGGVTFANILEDLLKKSEEPQNVPVPFRRAISVEELRRTRIFLSTSPLSSSDRCEVTSGLEVGPCCIKFGSFLSFELFREAEAKVAQAQNAFSTMMDASRRIGSQLKLPELRGSEELRERADYRGDWRLYNDLVSFLAEKNLGFTNGCESTSGKAFVSVLANTLFEVLPSSREERLSIRAVQLPQYFRPLQQKERDRSYHDPAKHGHGKLPPLQRVRLDELVTQMMEVRSSPWFLHQRWREMTRAFDDLLAGLVKYRDYLDSTSKRVNEMHALLEPVRNPLQGTSSAVQRREAQVRDSKTAFRYAALEKRLANEPHYGDPVSLLDFVPKDKQKRYEYIHSVKLPFAVELYHYDHGNFLGKLWWIWRVPEDPIDSDNNKATRIINGIIKSIPVFHTRAMRRAFIDRYELITGLSPTLLSEMYEHLTGDASAAPSKISKDVRIRLKIALESQDPELLYDLRCMNQGKPAKYDQFWEAAQQFIESSALQAVDSRRHGQVCHLATAISARDFLEQVAKMLPDGVAVPCESWLRLQFWPKNPYVAAAAQHTGKLKVRYMVQARQLNAEHQDGHYAAAIFRYLRELAIKFRERTTLVCLDDKHAIKIGEPGLPVAAVERGKRVLVSKDVSFCVSDHDFTKAKVTPSVSLICDIPENIGESFYSGKVAVCLKETTFAPSSPLRHATELLQLLRSSGINSIRKPVLLLYTDGGPDHRVTYMSVKMALICLFRKLQLDYLVAARTAPMQSYRNPVERMMSLLNLGLQSVGLMRQAMVGDLEQIYSKCSNLSDVRSAAEWHPELKEELQQSVRPAIALMEDVFSRLKLHDEHVTTMPQASADEMEELWQMMESIDSTVQRSDTTQEKTKDKVKLKEFMEHCCCSRHYFFSIKKCGKDDCTICGRPTLPPDEFFALHPFPDPMKVLGQPHYKDFSDVWGQKTKETDRPSLSSAKCSDSTLDGVEFTAKAETARAVIVCTECGKPRCLHSAKKLLPEQIKQLEDLKEEHTYVCGAFVTTPDSPLRGKVAVRVGLTCSTEVSYHYFSSKKFPRICYVCGDTNVEEVPAALKEQYQTVHALCATCRSKGKKERVRGERKVAKAVKRKHHQK